MVKTISRYCSFKIRRTYRSWEEGTDELLELETSVHEEATENLKKVLNGQRREIFCAFFVCQKWKDNDLQCFRSFSDLHVKITYLLKTEISFFLIK